MADEDLVLLGQIVNAHGIRGEVVVRAFTADPADIAAYGPLVARGRGRGRERSLELKVVRVTDKGVIARAVGVSDRNAAEALKGIELLVPRNRLPEAGPEEYYHSDLIGLTAVAPDGAVVGRVIAVHNFGAGDLLEIQFAGAKETELIPFREPFVGAIDLGGRSVSVDIPRTPDDTPSTKSD